jgi:hypothetical protein
MAKSPKEALHPREEDTKDTIIIDTRLLNYLKDDLSDLKEPKELVFRGGNTLTLKETQKGPSKT